MAFIADSYQITTFGLGRSDSPHSWTFKGSLDNLVWDTLDTRSHYNFVAQSDVFSFSNTASYQYYMLDITLTLGSWGQQIVAFEIRASGVNQCATMTANNAPSPVVVSADHVWQAGYEAFRAFDGNPATTWTNGVANTGWLKYDSGVDAPVVLYPITLTYPTNHAFVVSPDYFKWEIPVA